MEALDVDDVIAHLLVSEGFTSVEDVAVVPIETLGGIEGFSEEVAGELKQRAENFVKERDEKFANERKELGITEDLSSIEALNQEMVLALGRAGVKSKDDLADLATDELMEILKAFNTTQIAAEKLIMDARAHWFASETPSADQPTA
jgi:N utilization substance protein A